MTSGGHPLAQVSAVVRMAAGCHPTHMCRKEKEDAHTQSRMSVEVLIEIIIERFLAVYEQ